MAKQAAKHGKGNGGMDILLVEDNPSYVELTVRALGEIAGDDLRVAVASTGERALEILRHQPAIEVDIAGVLAIGAGQDFDQGGFAGAVLANQCVDLAPRNF